MWVPTHTGCGPSATGYLVAEGVHPRAVDPTFVDTVRPRTRRHRSTAKLPGGNLAVSTLQPTRPRAAPRSSREPEPILEGQKSGTEAFLVKLFAVVPLLAVVAAVPLAWGWD
ncbi:hypothetical protein GCM10009754_85050 [Amycolatopsis minnesotensis]|uniref:Uncharacterized protein n=1 Tax=Amycolatopsis minnesotensis TaxID=337894 RepID=A0ABP5ECZ3_9PSEU